MNDINASIGLENIDAARQSVTLSRLNSKFYSSLVNNPLLTLPEWDNTCSYWLFSMHVKAGLKDHFTKYLADRGIASNGLEARVPFLDHDFINFYFQKLILYNTNNRTRQRCQKVIKIPA